MSTKNVVGARKILDLAESGDVEIKEDGYIWTRVTRLTYHGISTVRAAWIIHHKEIPPKGASIKRVDNYNKSLARDNLRMEDSNEGEGDYGLVVDEPGEVLDDAGWQDLLDAFDT